MTPEELQNASMLDLFRLEAEAQTRVLNAGLLELERDPANAEQLEACMRAAHSLKGAARIVDLDNGVRIAHAMEDLLVAAQEGRLRLAAPQIDALLTGADLLARIGSISADATGVATNAFVARLRPLLDGGDHHPGVADAGDAPVEAAVAPAEPVTAEPVPVPDGAAELSGLRARMLRVSASHLDHMLDMSAKSLVEFQQVTPLRTSLDRLKRLQYGTGRALDALQETLGDGAGDPNAMALLEEARRLLDDCRGTLQQHIERFEEFSWVGARRSRQLYDAALASRMRRFSEVTVGWDRMVRDLARELGKRARLELVGGDTQVDRDVLERLDAPLVHLLRNAVDHGIESPEVRRGLGKAEEGQVILRARHQAGMLILELSDDGAGVDIERLRHTVAARGLAAADIAGRLDEDELLAFLLLPGFSLRDRVTRVSGRGVGLDAVQHELRQLRGGLRMSQRQGAGSTFHVDVPLTLSVVRSLVVEIGDEAYAFPLSHIERMIRIRPDEIVQLEGRQHFWHDGRHVGLLLASQLLQTPEGRVDETGIPVVLIRDDRQLCGVAVDGLVGERNLVVVPLDARLGKIKDVSAGAVLDDGRPVLILDVEDLLGTIGKLLGSGNLERVARRAREVETRRKRILVVDDSLTVRELERKLLAGRGYGVAVAVDGVDGWNALRGAAFDLLITDIDMPRMDGIELVTRVRGNSRLQSMPVMVVSYKDRDEDRQRGLEAGADYYLAKGSFHDETLLDAVQALIGSPLG